MPSLRPQVKRWVLRDGWGTGHLRKRSSLGLSSMRTQSRKRRSLWQYNTAGAFCPLVCVLPTDDDCRGSQSIELLSVADNASAGTVFRSVCNIATAFRPIALKGDLIAVSDEGSDTVIMNWRENTFALLKGSERVVDERFKVCPPFELLATLR